MAETNMHVSYDSCYNKNAHIYILVRRTRCKTKRWNCKQRRHVLILYGHFNNVFIFHVTLHLHAQATIDDYTHSTRTEVRSDLPLPKSKLAKTTVGSNVFFAISNLSHGFSLYIKIYDRIRKNYSKRIHKKWLRSWSCFNVVPKIAFKRYKDLSHSIFCTSIYSGFVIFYFIFGYHIETMPNGGLYTVPNTRKSTER